MSKNAGARISKYTTDKDWEYYGKTNPYYGVVSWDKFKQESLSSEAIEDFFETGKQYVDTILDISHQYLDPDFQPQHALDFGCGVGRIAIPLASVCKSVTGVDVSESMLQEAVKNCTKRDIDNAIFIKGNDSLSDVFSLGKKFDFVHSFIVFQHIPCERGEAILKQLISLLESEGIGVLHFTYFKHASWMRKVAIKIGKQFPVLVRLKDYVKGVDYKPMMQMNSYNLNAIFHILQENSCHHSLVRFTRHSEDEGVIIFFKKTSQPSL